MKPGGGRGDGPRRTGVNGLVTLVVLLAVRGARLTPNVGRKGHLGDLFQESRQRAFVAKRQTGAAVPFFQQTGRQAAVAEPQLNLQGELSKALDQRLVNSRFRLCN